MTPLLLVQFKAFYQQEEILAAVKSFVESQTHPSFKLAIALPLLLIEPVKTVLTLKEGMLMGTNMALLTDDQTFTGSIEIPLLISAGVQFVLIDISSGEDSNKIKDRIKKVLASKIMPIICVRDTQQQFDDDQSEDVLKQQVKEILGDLPPENLSGLHILYDASWINETPWEASNQYLIEGYARFKKILNDVFEENVVHTLKILYAVPTYLSLIHI